MTLDWLDNFIHGLTVKARLFAQRHESLVARLFGRIPLIPNPLMGGAWAECVSDSKLPRRMLRPNPNASASFFIVRSVSLSPDHLSIREITLCGRPQDKARSACVIPTLFRHSRTCWPKLIIAPILLLSACASKPEIAVNSYCEIKATELIDLRDPGLQRLTPVNQGAVLTGDDNHARFCRGAVNKGR